MVRSGVLGGVVAVVAGCGCVFGQATTGQVAAGPATVAQAADQRTGVAHPDEAPIEATTEQPVEVRAKPSAAVPMGETTEAATERATAGTRAGTPARVTEYGAYVPYTGARTSVAAAGRPLTEDEADASVVTSVADPVGALREGTLLQARLLERLSTLSTEEGARFSAELVTPVEKDGRVVLPVGTVVSGRVTSVHGGRRISGKAAIHLEPDTIAVPGGPRYSARLRVIDTDQTSQTKVDSEGSLVKRDHAKETAAVFGLAAGGGAAAGGVAGGPVGAAVGAGVGAGVGTVLWLKQDRQEVVPEHALLVLLLEREMPLQTAGETHDVAASHATRPVIDPDASVVGVTQ